MSLRSGLLLRPPGADPGDEASPAGELTDWRRREVLGDPQSDSAQESTNRAAAHKPPNARAMKRMIGLKASVASISPDYCRLRAKILERRRSSSTRRWETVPKTCLAEPW